MKKTSYLYFVIIAVGLLLAGFFPGYYYYNSKFNNNTVTVKGLAEQDVIADLAIWKIKFVATGNELSETQADIDNQTQELIGFLKDNGFEDSEIESGQLETNDLMTNPYLDKDARTSRFILTKTMTLRSDKVQNVSAAFAKTGDLISRGVIFSDQYTYPVSYLFTKLNDIKPQMLELATQNAREAAIEFAKSSNSKVGKIHKANQGVFSILPRDETNDTSANQQINKKVRVVSTIEYFLE
ncbi:MAG: SIMPL domain-containing protein [Alphaproteobacteria bacterium]